jgi:hypothetical protein
MLKKKLHIAVVAIALAFFALVPTASFAADTIIKNAGFAPGNIWFSKNDFVPGDVVKVYTILWNGGKETITGEVVFYDNDFTIGKIPFSLPAGGTKIASVEWKVTDGYHKVYAVVATSKIGSSGATLEYAKTDESEHFVGAPIKATSPTSTAQQIIDQKVDFVREYAAENLPTPVTKTAQSVAGVIEPFRTNVKTWTDDTSVKVRKDIEAIDTSANKNGNKEDPWSLVKRPLDYIYIFALMMTGFVFGNPFIFYGFIILILFFVLRFLKRKFIF